MAPDESLARGRLRGLFASVVARVNRLPEFPAVHPDVVLAVHPGETGGRVESPANSGATLHGRLTEPSSFVARLLTRRRYPWVVYLASVTILSSVLSVLGIERSLVGHAGLSSLRAVAPGVVMGVEMLSIILISGGLGVVVTGVVLWVHPRHRIPRPPERRVALMVLTDGETDNVYPAYVGDSWATNRAQNETTISGLLRELLTKPYADHVQFTTITDTTTTSETTTNSTTNTTGVGGDGESIGGVGGGSVVEGLVAAPGAVVTGELRLTEARPGDALLGETPAEEEGVLGSESDMGVLMEELIAELTHLDVPVVMQTVSGAYPNGSQAVARKRLRKQHGLDVGIVRRFIHGVLRTSTPSTRYYEQTDQESMGEEEPGGDLRFIVNLRVLALTETPGERAAVTDYIRAVAGNVDSLFAEDCSVSMAVHANDDGLFSRRRANRVISDMHHRRLRTRRPELTRLLTPSRQPYLPLGTDGIWHVSRIPQNARTATTRALTITPLDQFPTGRPPFDQLTTLTGSYRDTPPTTPQPDTDTDSETHADADPEDETGPRADPQSREHAPEHDEVNPRDDATGSQDDTDPRRESDASE